MTHLQISACSADRTRHCRGAACRSRRCTCSPYRPPSKWHAPIASVAAFPAQPLAALPPYGCGVPFTVGECLWQLQISACSAGRIRHCRGAACRSRRCTCSPYRPPPKWHAPIASVAALSERLVGVIQRQQGTGAPRHSLTCHCEAPKWPWRPERAARGSALGVQSRRARLNHWKAFGENANRFTGTVSVKMYLTFRARGDIIKMWKPGRLPQHMCFWICEVYYSQINEPSVAADGSLFTISEPVDDLANQPEDRKYPEQVLKCYMYHLLRDISRRGYTCLPPFRSCGMTGNRL